MEGLKLTSEDVMKLIDEEGLRRKGGYDWQKII